MIHFQPRTTGRAACLAVVGTGLLTACAVGPNFKAPEAPRGAGFAPSGQIAPVTTAASLPGGQAQRFVDGMDIPGQWWTLFQSAPLNALIERALRNSPTLRAAQAALRQANETAAAQRGSYYPSLSGTAQSERQKGSGASFGIPGFPSSYFYNLQTASVSVSYTLDAFGGTRRQVEALQAQAEYQQFALEASYLTLTSNIVAAAVNEASLRAQISSTEDIARSQQMQLDITRRRFTAGAASRADVLQQQATLQATLATLPSLRSQLAQERNQLAAYIGDFPSDYAGGEFNLDSLNMPQDLPVSLPSKLVEQRPDIREYSALLHQATAQIGVATANMLPQITISGSYGQDASKWANIFSPTSNVFGLIGSITQPIFKGGQLLHQRRAAVAAAQEAAANYQATVITAFQNVSNTLYALQADADALAAQTTAERSAADSLTLVQAQYKNGGASYLQVLSSEQIYQTAAIALVKARAQRYADTAALFQALGGAVSGARRRLVESKRRARGHLDRAAFPAIAVTLAQRTEDEYFGKTERSSVKKRMVMMILGVLLLVAGIGFVVFRNIMQQIAQGAVPQPAVVVTAIKAARQEWQPQLNAVGSMRAVRGVDVTSEIAGLVREIRFKSGDEVKAGAVLIQLNADSDLATLAALEAAADLAQVTLKRDRAQLAAEAISQAQVDGDEADLKSKRAQAASQQATIDKKTIRAPFSGRLGITLVNPGQYLNPGDKVVTLQTIDPIFIDFNLPQQQVSAISLGQPVTVSSDAYLGRTFDGKVTAIDAKVDTATRNVQIEATVANPKKLLLPGMFGRTVVDSGEKQSYLTLPQTAITYNPYGATVFIAADKKDAKGNPQLQAQQVFITPGPTRGDQVAILKGVSEGAMVVTSGQLKLKNGSPVRIDNSVQPMNDQNPRPQEQ